MKRKLAIVLTTIITIMLFTVGTPVKANNETEGYYKKDSLLVVYKSNKRVNISKIMGTTVKKTDSSKFDGKTITEITIPTNEDLDEWIDILSDNKNIELVQKNYIYKSLSNVYKINDPDIKYQWHLKNILATGGTQNAWDYASGKGVEIGVIDTGISLNKEVKNNIKSYYDALLDSTTTTVTDVSSVSHGTHVAGIISAVGNNNYLGAGVAYNSKLNIAQVFKTNRFADSLDVLAGYDYLINKTNSKVINMSLGYYAGEEPEDIDTLFKEAIDSAYNKGIVTVCAGGNGIDRVAQTINMYPSDFENTISVIPTDEKNVRPEWADYNEHKDFAAPGIDIVSVDKNGKLASMNGSSMAAPIVSGTIALMYEVNPNLTAAQIKNILINTSEDLGATGKDDYYGYGKINTLAAVKKAGGFTGAKIKINAVTLKKSYVKKFKKMKFKYNINKAGYVNIKVYNNKNKLIQNIKKRAILGKNTASWNFRNLKNKKVKKDTYYFKITASVGKEISDEFTSKKFKVK